MTESTYAGRSVLVTGAHGFIGSWLTDRLLSEGARVVVLQRESQEDSHFARAGLEERCEHVRGDLQDLNSLIRALNEHDVSEVFHLGARTIAAEANRSPMEGFDVNVRGTWNLLEACRVTELPEAVVVASSYHAYARDTDQALDEDSPFGAEWPYDVSKACADLIARCYAASWDVPVAATRLANVYGGGDRNWARLVPDAARALVAGDAPVIRSDGRPERDFIYIEDAVDAYLRVAESTRDPRLRGRAWNVGSGEPVSVRELVLRLVAASGRDVAPVVEGERAATGSMDRQFLDSGAIRRELGWGPRWSLDDGLRVTYDWYESALS